MINLLPDEEKRQLHAARSNTLLVRYNILLVVAIVFMLLATGFVYIYFNTAKAANEATINENKTKVSSFADVEAEAAQFRANLATAKQILDREVIYTKVILEIAHLMPAGTILEGLNLDSAAFGTPTTLSAKAKTYNDAIALKDAFQRSSIFSDVHFDSVTASEAAGTDYQLTVNMSVTIKKDAAK
jgi:Tfp pilus assembly protein PilN